MTQIPPSSFQNTPIKASNVIGKDVVNSMQENLGDIKELMLDPVSGKIAYAVLSFGGFLGLGEKLFAVPFSALTYSHVNDEYVLDVSKDILGKAPGFSVIFAPVRHLSDFVGRLHQMSLTPMNTSMPLPRSPATPEYQNLRASADVAKLAGLQLSAVSWAAIWAGAATATVMSIVLLILGTGLGLSVVSPWSAKGISAIGLGITAIVWLTLTQLISSGLGGYIAGRLRTRWDHVDKSETYFRDTAHGFLSWAVSTLVTATVLASFVSSITGAGTQAAATVIGGASIAGATAAHVGLTPSEADNLQNVYFLDSLFRVPSSASSVSGPRTSSERLSPEISAS
eukprot:gene28308-35148_t